MDTRRVCCAWVLAAVLVTAGCGGKESPAAPTAAPNPSTTEPTPTGLRIAGVPSSLSPGATAQLTAELTLANGATRDCAAGWSTDDRNVATVSESGLLTSGALGYVTVAASCSGFIARAQTRVAAISPYSILILAYDAEVPTEYGVDATIEFLDGPRAGERISAYATLGPAPIRGLEWPVRIRLTAERYQPREIVISASTGSRRNPMSSLFDVNAPMTFAPDAETDTYVRTMSATQMEIAHPLQLRAAGPVDVRTWWSVDYNDFLSVQLWCGGRMLRSADQRAYSVGDGFTQSVPSAGPCEVRMRQSKSDAGTRYRVAIRYSH